MIDLEVDDDAMSMSDGSDAGICGHLVPSIQTKNEDKHLLK